MNSCADTQQVPGIPRFQAVVRAIIFRKLPMVFFSNLAARIIQPEVERRIAGSCERTQTGTVNLPLQACRKSLPYEITCVSTAKTSIAKQYNRRSHTGFVRRIQYMFLFSAHHVLVSVGNIRTCAAVSFHNNSFDFFRSGTLPFPCFKCKINLCICQSPQSNF